MSPSEQKQRVALLGAREEETELLAELHRSARCDLVGVYDPDPQALGLPLAEIMGIESGSDAASRERFLQADYVVLPRDRMAFRDDVQWCSGLRAQLVGLAEARQRWGRLKGTPRERAATPDTSEALLELQRAGERLRSPEHLADWLLDITMPAIGATGGSIQLLSSTSEELYLVAGRGLSEHTLHNARRSLGEAISGLVAATRQARILHGDHVSHPERDRDAIHSAVSLPLELEDGTLVGVLNLSTSVHGQRFEEAHVRLLQALAPRCAVLLHDAVQCSSQRDAEYEERLVSLLETLEEHQGDLRAGLLKLVHLARQEAEATSFQVWLCRNEGDWVPMAQVSQDDTHMPLLPSDEAADQVLLDRRWVLLPQSGRRLGELRDPGKDPVEHAFNRQIQEGREETAVLAPLVGTASLGLVVAEFASAAQAESFVRVGRTMVRDLALILESRLQQEEAQERVATLSRLAHALPRLLQAVRDNGLPREILEQARNLVRAQQVSFRRVDMLQRRYSPPLCLGVPEDEWDTWRKRDAHVTEDTLRRNESVLTTTLDNASGNEDGASRVHSWLSLAIRRDAELLAVLNVYEKEPRAPWSDASFTAFDHDILESLAVLLSAVLQTETPNHATASDTSVARPQAGS